MLDGTLFIVKCARYGNPDKNLYQDFFCLKDKRIVILLRGF